MPSGSVDLDMDDDVFSDADSCIDLGEDDKIDHDNQNTNECFEQTKTIWSNLSKESSQELIKKLTYKGNNSPVGDLQRWVDGHFGNQSPVDFPRELTPPRTPVEEVISNASFSSKEVLPEVPRTMPQSLPILSGGK